MKTFNFEKFLRTLQGEEVAYYPFYNGGWIKKVIGLDKTKQNGFSITGDFVEKEGDWIFEDGLYLLCDKQGSRANQRWNYYLLKLQNQEPQLIFKVMDGKKDWALKFWEPIEKELNGENDEEKIKERLQMLIKEFGMEKVREVLQKWEEVVE